MALPAKVAAVQGPVLRREGRGEEQGEQEGVAHASLG
jgi:hypothetical protein